MVNSLQAEKAKIFLELHKKDNLLILPNIWNPIGARILQANGYPAAATASAAISAMLGYSDGEKIKLTTHLDIIRRIVSSVNIPVTADVEAGYASNLVELEESIVRIIETGVAGINIEDSLDKGVGLRSVEEQCSRIAIIRENSDKAGIPLVINARVDTFVLKNDTPEDTKIEETIHRAAEYIKAGADCIYPIGIMQKDTLVTLRKRINSPLNALASPAALPLKTLQEIGINRVSFGPYIFRSCMGKFEKIINELKIMGSYECFTNEILSYDKITSYLRDDREK